MKPRRWIIVDTKCGTGQPYLGTRGWGFTVAAAGSYERREDADNALGSLAGCAQGRLVVRPVVPAGTKRARAAAQADADNVATMRAELEGLRATDAEMASRVAMAEQQTTGWATAYHSASEREERVRRALGARGEEATDEAAKRVAGELAELQQANTRIIAAARV